MFSKYQVLNGGTRLRLSAKAIEAWGVQSQSGNFQCIGVFWEEGELICTPESVRTEDDEHPFESVMHLSKLVRPPAATAIPIHELPSAFDLVASDRIIQFNARWTKEQKQLDLSLGKEAFERLGYSNSQPTVYVAVWGATIILLSDVRYEALRAKPILG